MTGNIGAPYEGVKMPMELEYMPSMVNLTLPNDDLDLQVLWLDVVEKKGLDFTSYDLLKRFCENCDYSPGEYVVMRRNFMRGVYPPYSGRFSNDFYIEGMGCPIRSEIWGCLAAGNPPKVVRNRY
nr:ADP-ribosylglycohydrolase family protein [Clostridia bacterium]